MNPIVTVVVSLINALAALMPQIGGLIERIRASNDLSADGRALLDAIEGGIDKHVRYLDEKSKPLPVPD